MLYGIFGSALLIMGICLYGMLDFMPSFISYIPLVSAAFGAFLYGIFIEKYFKGK